MTCDDPPEHTVPEFVLPWLVCPRCESTGDEGHVVIDADHEHLSIGCDFCGTMTQIHHGEFDDFPIGGGE